MQALPHCTTGPNVLCHATQATHCTMPAPHSAAQPHCATQTPAHMAALRRVPRFLEALDPMDHITGPCPLQQVQAKEAGGWRGSPGTPTVVGQEWYPSQESRSCMQPVGCQLNRPVLAHVAEHISRLKIYIQTVKFPVLNK